MNNTVNWFEIPVKDFARAKVFYEKLLGADIRVIPNPFFEYGMLPGKSKNGNMGGAIVKGNGYSPSQTGILIYLNGGEDLSFALTRAELAGGQIVLPKTSLGPNGFMAHLIDTEGNKIGLHSMS